MTGLLDTNVALYLLGGQLAEPLPAGSYGVSVITEMELLAWPSLTTEEEKKVREFLRAGCDLRIDSIDSWASRAAQERATFKAPGCCRVRDRDGIWRRALDERYIARESAWTKLPRCKRYENLADQIRAINFLLRLTHSTSRAGSAALTGRFRR